MTAPSSPTQESPMKGEERELKALADDLRPYAAKTLGSIRIDVSEVAKIVAALDRLLTPAIEPKETEHG